MKTFFLLLVTMAVWHFLYEGIIAPSIRMHLRNKLFVLRDELRRLNPKGLSTNDREAYWFVHDGINNFLNRLPNLTIHTAKRLEREYRNDARIGEILESHLSKVLNAENVVIRNVFSKTNRVIGEAMLTNAGASFLYVIPFALVVIFAQSIRVWVSRLLLTPKNEVDRLVPMTPV